MSALSPSPAAPSAAARSLVAAAARPSANIAARSTAFNGSTTAPPTITAAAANGAAGTATSSRAAVAVQQRGSKVRAASGSSNSHSHNHSGPAIAGSANTAAAFSSTASRLALPPRPSSASSSAATSSSSASSARRFVPRLTLADRSVLTDVDYIADWLLSVRQSGQLQAFAPVIARLKKTIFTPEQVRRHKLQHPSTASLSSSRGAVHARHAHSSSTSVVKEHSSEHKEHAADAYHTHAHTASASDIDHLGSSGRIVPAQSRSASGSKPSTSAAAASSSSPPSSLSAVPASPPSSSPASSASASPLSSSPRSAASFDAADSLDLDELDDWDEKVALYSQRADKQHVEHDRQINRQHRQQQPSLGPSSSHRIAAHTAQHSSTQHADRCQHADVSHGRLPLSVSCFPVSPRRCAVCARPLGGCFWNCCYHCHSCYRYCCHPSPNHSLRLRCAFLGPPASLWPTPSLPTLSVAAGSVDGSSSPPSASPSSRLLSDASDSQSSTPDLSPGAAHFNSTRAEEAAAFPDDLDDLPDWDEPRPSSSSSSSSASSHSAIAAAAAAAAVATAGRSSPSLSLQSTASSTSSLSCPPPTDEFDELDSIPDFDGAAAVGPAAVGRSGIDSRTSELLKAKMAQFPDDMTVVELREIDDQTSTADDNTTDAETDDDDNNSKGSNTLSQPATAQQSAAAAAKQRQQQQQQLEASPSQSVDGNSGGPSAASSFSTARLSVSGPSSSVVSRLHNRLLRVSMGSAEQFPLISMTCPMTATSQRNRSQPRQAQSQPPSSLCSVLPAAALLRR